MCMIVLIASLLPPTCTGSVLWRGSSTGDEASRADAMAVGVLGSPAAGPRAHVSSTTKATTAVKAAITIARKVATNNAKVQTVATTMTTVISNVRHL